MQSDARQAPCTCVVSAATFAGTSLPASPTCRTTSMPLPAGQYPGLPEARRHLLTVVQHPGEAIFVPAGWFHTGWSAGWLLRGRV